MEADKWNNESLDLQGYRHFQVRVGKKDMKQGYTGSSCEPWNIPVCLLF
jgi:hypothetical protein